MKMTIDEAVEQASDWCSDCDRTTFWSGEVCTGCGRVWGDPCTPDTAPTMRTEEEIRTKLADVTERMEGARSDQVSVMFLMYAVGLKWVLGEEMPWP